MTMEKAENLFKDAGEGETLTKDERRRAVEWAELHHAMSAGQMATHFEVSERTIYSDLEAINQEYKRMSGRFSIVYGELIKTYRQVRKELLVGKMNADPGEGEHRKYLKELWGISMDLAKFLVDPKVQEYHSLLTDMDSGEEGGKEVDTDKQPIPVIEEGDDQDKEKSEYGIKRRRKVTSK